MWISKKSVLNATTAEGNTIEPVLKDYPIGHKNVVSQDRWVLGDGFIYIEMWDFLSKSGGPSRQVVS